MNEDLNLKSKKTKLQIFDELKEKIKDFPTQSGVYLMKNEIDKII